MQVFLQNCPWDYSDDNKLKKSMNSQDVSSLQECVGEHTKSLLKPQQASPTCISGITNNLQITNNLPGVNGVTWGERGNGVTWGRNTIKSFSADSKFPVGRTRKLTRGKIENVPYPSHQSSCPE
jgi:hypothetical protein